MLSCCCRRLVTIQACAPDVTFISLSPSLPSPVRASAFATAALLLLTLLLSSRFSVSSLSPSQAKPSQAKFAPPPSLLPYPLSRRHRHLVTIQSGSATIAAILLPPSLSNVAKLSLLYLRVIAAIFLTLLLLYCRRLFRQDKCWPPPDRWSPSPVCYSSS